MTIYVVADTAINHEQQWPNSCSHSSVVELRRNLHHMAVTTEPFSNNFSTDDDDGSDAISTSANDSSSINRS